MRVLLSPQSFGRGAVAAALGAAASPLATQVPQAGEKDKDLIELSKATRSEHDIIPSPRSAEKGEANKGNDETVCQISGKLPQQAQVGLAPDPNTHGSGPGKENAPTRENQDAGHVTLGSSGEVNRFNPQARLTDPTSRVGIASGRTSLRPLDTDTLEAVHPPDFSTVGNESAWQGPASEIDARRLLVCPYPGCTGVFQRRSGLEVHFRVHTRHAGVVYVSDLDLQTLKRAAGSLNATDKEKGPCVPDDPTEEQFQQTLKLNAAGPETAPAATPAPATQPRKSTKPTV